MSDQPLASQQTIASAPVVSWYHEKWFVVLLLCLFFPVGLALLWTSPRTKLVGRLVWSVVCTLAIFAVISPDTPPRKNEQTAKATAVISNPSATTAKTSSAPAVPPTPAKDEFNFTLTDKGSGKSYKGKIVSDVAVAIVETKTETTLGNQYITERASPGATFAVLKIYVKNNQKDAITLDGSLFDLLYDGKEYSYSIDGSTAIEMADQGESFFLKQINPGIGAEGMIPFEVPEDIDLDKAQLQFRGGMTGHTSTLPAKPVTK